jgi:quercetin dioxygenase-like cupin family protein
MPSHENFDLESFFASPSDEDWTPSAKGVERRVRLDLPEMMVVEFRFEAGAVGAPHAHPHVQSSYIREGMFDVTIAGMTKRLGAGGGFIVPGGLEHGVFAVERGLLVDVFTPRREDFLRV